jgi:hypothetical protein
MLVDSYFRPINFQLKKGSLGLFDGDYIKHLKLQILAA